MLIVLMIVAAIVMIVAVQKHKAGKRWGQPLALLCGLAILGLAVMSMTKGPAGSGVAEIEKEYQRISGQKLASYLTQKQKFSKAVYLKQQRYHYTFY